MKRLLLICVALTAATTIYAQQSLGVLTGIPVTKKTADPVLGAVVTLVNDWDRKDVHQRLVTDEGFRLVVPHGSYKLTVEKEGYETYSLELTVDAPEIDLGYMRMLTDEMVEAKEAKRAKRKAKWN